MINARTARIVGSILLIVINARTIVNDVINTRLIVSKYSNIYTHYSIIVINLPITGTYRIVQYTVNEINLTTVYLVPYKYYIYPVPV